MGYNIAIITKTNIDALRCHVLMKDGKYYPGTYMFTIDSCSSDPTVFSTSWDDLPSEHKSFNIIRLDNGQFAAQPNNRIRWEHSSLIPVNPKTPKFFKVCDIDYQVEDTPKWSVSDTTSYFYKEKSEELVAQELIEKETKTAVKEDLPA